MSSDIARLLQGKSKPDYSPHLEMGDYVVVINASAVHVTGRKKEQKRYYRHSGYPGGLKEITLSKQLDKNPDRVIKSAVKGMMPRTAIGRHAMSRLHVYAGEEHPHAAQTPEVYEI